MFPHVTLGFTLILHGLVVGTHAWRLTVTHTSLTPRTFTVTCSSDEPLTGCVFRTYYDNERSTRVHNYTGTGTGTGEDTATAANGDRLYTTRYAGTGLRAGECGAVFTRVGSIRMQVGCHVRAETGGWQRGTVSYSEWGEKHTYTPQVTIAQPGGNHTIQCDNDQLTQCWLDLPGPGKTAKQVLAPHALIRNSDVWYLYKKPSEDKSDVCSFTILDMIEEDSGPMWCAGYSSFFRFKTALVIVAKPLEGPPDLRLTSSAYYKQGTTLTASCEVRNARPAPNITWLLGSSVLRSDALDDADREVWKWSWQGVTFTQRISYQLKVEDNGKDLTCRVAHFDTVQKSRIKIKFTEAPSCGQRKSASGLISRGNEAGRHEFPWHAGLYKLGEKTYQQQCGGSLITDSFVITAAHCFSEINSGRVPNMNLYKIVLGKHHLDYDRADSGAQTRDVANVTVPFDYVGFQGFYHYDIAVVRLGAKVQITASVQIVCLDWTNRLEAAQLTAGAAGVVPGWGLNERGVQDPVLQWVSLPWVSKRTCRGAIPDHSRQFLSHDKFCAGYVNANTSVCAGDSGGGLAFFDPGTQSYYLRGIVSTSFDVTTDRTCFSRLYTGFTLVSEYVRNNFLKANIR